MTIEEVMLLALKLTQVQMRASRYDAAESEVVEVEQELRAALAALVAQARDEEAEACANALERTGDSSAGYFIRDRIRARIAGRKDGGART